MLSLRTALVAFFAFSSISSFATAKECKVRIDVDE
jgi:hypothetical protein